MRLTSSRLDQLSLASKEFIMKQKGFDIIRINKDLFILSVWREIELCL